MPFHSQIKLQLIFLTILHKLFVIIKQIIFTMFLLKEQKQSTPSIYDETHLEVKVNHGRSQLQQIRIVHWWSNSTIKWRLPKLKCQWFNKTQNSMEPIPTVTDEFYQPSIVDVGTSIYIQIVPQSKDLEYQGMPITRSIGPIQLATQTQQQAQQLLQAGKSTFFIELKQLYLKQLSDQEQEPVQGKVPIKQCLLKIVNNKLMLLGKTISQEKSNTLISCDIGKEYPQLQIDRTCSKFLNVLFNAQEYAILILQNNKVRDVLYLLIKNMQEKTNKKQDITVKEQAAKSQSSLCEPNREINIKETSENNEKIEATKKHEQSQPLSPQTIQKQTNQSANLIIISQLRTKIAKLQNEYSKSTKEIQSLKSKLQNLQNLVDNSSKELQKSKATLVKTQQELRKLKEKKQKQIQERFYLKNQCRILQQKNQSLTLKNEELNLKIKQLQKQLILSQEDKIKFAPFHTLNLHEALALIIKKDRQIEQLHLKNQYQQSQMQNQQQQIALLKVQLQQIQSVNKHLSKKVQSLTQSQSKLKQSLSNLDKQQIQALNFTISKQKQQLSLQKISVQSRQKQKISLKIQIKELIEENTCLRSKQKSSKQQLKLQVVELKKLMNRFTQMITQKDMQISNLKLANKTLNTALLKYK